MRHAVARIRTEQAGDVDDVGHHGGSGRQCARTRAVIQGFAHHVGIHAHGVHHAVHIGQQAAFGQQGGVNAQFDAFVGFARDAQKFDAVAEFFGIFDVAAVEPADAFEIAGLEIDRRTERQRAHDGDFMPRVVAFDIEGRVGFGIAQSLRFFQYVGKRAAFFAHFAQDEIAGAVDDAGDAADAVGRQAFAQGFDDRDAARHRRFKLHHHIFFFRQRENFAAIFGQQFFIGGNDVFAVAYGFQHQLFGRFRAAEHFGYDVHFRVAHDFERVGGNQGFGRTGGAGFGFVARGHHKHVHRAPQPAADFRRVCAQHFRRAPAHGTQTQNADIDRFHHHSLLSVP